MANQKSGTTAHIKTLSHEFDYVSFAADSQHDKLVYQFNAYRLFFQHPTLPPGPYSVSFRFTQSLKAGTYDLSASRDDILLIYKWPNSGIDGEFKSVSGTLHLAYDPTPTTLVGTFDFEGRANTVALGPAYITDGSVSIDLEAEQVNKSQGNLKFDYTILSEPTPPDKKVSVHFESTSPSMFFAPNTDFFQVQARSDKDSSILFLLIPVDKLQTLKELKISVDEWGENALAVFFTQGRYSYWGHRGQIKYVYAPDTMKLTATFKFYEGDGNSFINGELDITGLNI